MKTSHFKFDSQDKPGISVKVRSLPTYVGVLAVTGPCFEFFCFYANTKGRSPNGRKEFGSGNRFAAKSKDFTITERDGRHFLTYKSAIHAVETIEVELTPEQAQEVRGKIENL